MLNDREFVGLKNKIQAKRDALVIKQSEMQKNKQRLEELKAEIIKHGILSDSPDFDVEVDKLLELKEKEMVEYLQKLEELV